MADRNYRSYADVTGVFLNGEDIAPPDPANWVDTLKLSNARDVNVQGCTILGAAEDCIDAMRGSHDIVISGCKLYPTGKYAVTIKGGSHDIMIVDTVIFGEGKEIDLDLGGWTSVNFDRSSRIVLDNVTRSDGKPVRVRVGHADKPTIIGGNVKIDHSGSLLLKAYWWVKYVLFKAGVK
jgi:hypothetical protein